nr:indole-3-glycerol phosphate synthase TrpC [Desulfobulbaceae bacterium]
MILDTIVARKKQEVAHLRANGIVEPDCEIAGPRGFKAALLADAGVSIIAEAKKASPSKGVISPNFDPVQIAKEYQAGGAHALSVLTDVDFFQGSLSYIPQVRSVVALPVIRKEFIIDALQIREASLYGADAILLIAAILEKAQIVDFLAQAREAGMDILVEVHDEYEAQMALEAGTDLLGINNRNLNDFTVDIETTFRVMAEVPADIPVVSESGIRDRSDMIRLAEHRVTAALIGETLMRSADRNQGLQELFGG